MTAIDDRGRVFGRINLIDAAAAVFLFVLIPVAYGAYLLFRTPPARLLSISPATVQHGPNQRIRIEGVNLRPFMRVSFGTTQGVTFAIDSTTSAQVEVPDLPPGAYDVVLYDYRQEVHRLPKALTVLSLATVPTVGMEATGRFVNLTDAAASAVRAGQKLGSASVAADVVQVGVPAPATLRFSAGPSTLTLPVPGQVELPATLRVACYMDVAADGSLRCLVPGPQRSVPMAPDAVLTLPSPTGWLNFQIDTVLPSVPSWLLEVRVAFVAAPEIAALIKAGDSDAEAVAYAASHRAAIMAVNGVRAAGTGPDGPMSVVDATLRLPVVRGATAWVYNTQPVKAGLPFRFETATYIVRGQVIAAKELTGRSQ